MCNHLLSKPYDSALKVNNSHFGWRFAQDLHKREHWLNWDKVRTVSAKARLLLEQDFEAHWKSIVKFQYGNWDIEQKETANRILLWSRVRKVSQPISSVWLNSQEKTHLVELCLKIMVCF